jgi:hypothetical protein
MFWQVLIISTLLVIFIAVMWITRVHRRRNLPCQPDSVDMERRQRIRSGF